MRDATFARVLWFWAKVVLVLIALDGALFGTGFIWTLTGSAGDATRRVAQTIGRHSPGEPAAVAVGSSLVGRSLSELWVNGLLDEKGVHSRFYNLGLDGLVAQEASLVAHYARRVKPWLVLYGVNYRDLMPAPAHGPGPGIRRYFVDSTVNLDALAPTSFDDRVRRFVRTHWSLYRYRRNLRSVAGAFWDELAASTPASAEAASEAADLAPDAPREAPTEAQQDRWLAEHTLTDEQKKAWARFHQTGQFSDYEAYLRTRGQILDVYRQRQETEFDLDANPAVEALEWMLAEARANGTRVVLIYMPENPMFRDPAAAEYFDQLRSDQVLLLLTSLAEQYGARFENWRFVLGPSDFLDMIHLNDLGQRRVRRAVSQVIAQEWELAQNAAATTGAPGP